MKWLKKERTGLETQNTSLGPCEGRNSSQKFNTVSESPGSHSQELAGKLTEELLYCNPVACTDDGCEGYLYILSPEIILNIVRCYQMCTSSMGNVPLGVLCIF